MKVSLDKLKSVDRKRATVEGGCTDAKEDDGKEAPHGSVFGRRIGFGMSSHSLSKGGSCILPKRGFCY